MALWFAMSTLFLNDEKIEELGEKHGSAAVSVVVALMTAAMDQRRGGVAEVTYRTVAHHSFTDPGVVREVIADACEVGFLTLEESNARGARVELRAWTRHQASFRKAKSRAEKKADNHAGSRVDVTGSHDLSRPVPSSHLQEKRREEKTGEEKSDVVPTPDAPLSNLLADLVAGNDPNGKRPNVTKTWATEEDRMVRLDERNPVEAERLIRWVQNDSFWRGNILSMPTFREKYNQLYQAAVKDTEKRKAPGVSQAERFAAKARQLEAEEQAV